MVRRIHAVGITLVVGIVKIDTHPVVRKDVVYAYRFHAAEIVSRTLGTFDSGGSLARIGKMRGELRIGVRFLVAGSVTAD